MNKLLEFIKKIIGTIIQCDFCNKEVRVHVYPPKWVSGRVKYQGSFLYPPSSDKKLSCPRSECIETLAEEVRRASERFVRESKLK